jgi:hypothetical protein
MWCSLPHSQAGESYGADFPMSGNAVGYSGKKKRERNRGAQSHTKSIREPSVGLFLICDQATSPPLLGLKTKLSGKYWPLGRLLACGQRISADGEERLTFQNCDGGTPSRTGKRHDHCPVGPGDCRNGGLRQSDQPYAIEQKSVHG